MWRLLCLVLVCLVFVDCLTLVTDQIAIMHTNPKHMNKRMNEYLNKTDNSTIEAEPWMS